MVFLRQPLHWAVGARNRGIAVVISSRLLFGPASPTNWSVVRALKLEPGATETWVLPIALRFLVFQRQGQLIVVLEDIRTRSQHLSHALAMAKPCQL